MNEHTSSKKLPNTKLKAVAVSARVLVALMVGVGIVAALTIVDMRRSGHFFWNQPEANLLDRRFDRRLVGLTVGSQFLKVELVNTAESLSQGLSNREALGSDGMLFILPRQSRPEFWMKEMLFDLDIIWINDGAISEITPGVPHPLPGRHWSSLPIYRPQTEVDWVLELTAGSAADLGLDVGDTVTIKLP